MPFNPLKNEPGLDANLIEQIKHEVENLVSQKLRGNESRYFQDSDPKMYLRETVLDEARRCICSDRQNQYGPPEDSFDLIAKFWNVYVNGIVKTREKNNDILTPHDVALMMVLLKIARTAGHEMKLDNYIDMAGYSALAAELSTIGIENS